MKNKILCLLMTITTLFSYTVNVNAANIGDVVNMTLYTDIVAKINGKDIASYNVNDYTVVVAENLREYGFNVEWNGNERALYITKNTSNPVITSTYAAPKISTDMIGKKAFDVLYSDIKTYMDGQLVTSYNISGQTVIYFDDLARYGNIAYDNNIRTLSGQFSWLKMSPNDILNLAKEKVKVRLVDFHTGSQTNASFGVEFINHSGSQIHIDNMAKANEYLCWSRNNEDYVLDTNYMVTLSFYKAMSFVNSARIFDAEYKTMYIDNNSLGTAWFTLNDTKIGVEFGTNGATQWWLSK